jgi:Na+/H+-translocating membrane pyrophosphatase
MEKKKLIKNQISIIKDESQKFLISEFKIILMSGILFCFLLVLIKGFESKVYLIVNILYGIIISLVCGYVSCTSGVNECELVFENSK